MYMGKKRHQTFSLVWRDKVKLFTSISDNERLHIPLEIAKQYILNKHIDKIYDTTFKYNKDEYESKYSIVVHIHGRGTYRKYISDIKPDDVIILPCKMGGINYGVFDPSSTTTIRDIKTKKKRTHGQQSLKKHLEMVGCKALKISKQLHLDEFSNEIYYAGLYHDIGKSDKHFQQTLGNTDMDNLLACSKNIPHNNNNNNQTNMKFIRHEIISSVLMSQYTENDLILHLIASHHGFARPFHRITSNEKPITVKYTIEGKEVIYTDIFDNTISIDIVERFWRVNQKYGIYVLAYLESILRCADQYISSLGDIN